MAQPKIIYREIERTPEEEAELRRISRERGLAWARMEADFPRVKAEHPDMWVAFSKDGLIAADDDLFALIEAYKKKGYDPELVLIEFTHVSTASFYGTVA